jgi:hypothetical protein
MAHHERNDCRLRREAAEKRQPHLDRVFARQRGVFADDVEFRQRVDDIGRNRQDPEWRVEPVGPRHGHAVEADEMRRAHHGHDVERAIAQQAVGMCGNRT